MEHTTDYIVPASMLIFSLIMLWAAIEPGDSKLFLRPKKEKK